MKQLSSDQLYREYRDLVFRFLFRMSSNTELCEELTQEVFLRAHRSLETFDPEKSAASTWLCTIARNEYYRYLSKKQPITESIDKEDSYTEIPDRGMTPLRRRFVPIYNALF